MWSSAYATAHTISELYKNVTYNRIFVGYFIKRTNIWLNVKSKTTGYKQGLKK
jgi:hypothetical protein